MKEYDADGYDKNGFDEYGFDKDGYDKDGFDEEGYSKEEPTPEATAEVKRLYSELNNILKQAEAKLHEAAEYANKHGLEFTQRLAGRYIPNSEFIFDEWEGKKRRNTGDSDYGETGWVTSFC